MRITRYSPVTKEIAERFVTRLKENIGREGDGGCRGIDDGFRRNHPEYNDAPHQGWMALPKNKKFLSLRDRRL